jgi:drug/metabolite transporter (DMT)-like permease
MDNNRKGALLIILAGTCWGVISIFINYLSAAGLGEMQISFLRQLFAVLVFAVILLIRNRPGFRIGARDLGLLMLVGFINGVLFNFLYFYTIIHSRASIAVVLLYTSPVFVIILARIIFKEKMTKLKFIALVLTVIGCVFVTGAIGEGYMPPPAAILTGVLTGLAYALNNILTSAAVKKNDPQTVTFYTLFFSFLFLIPFSGWSSLTSLCRANPMILAVAFLMCIVTAVLAQYFFSVGLGLIESGKAAIYGAAEPVVGSLVGILIFREESNFMKIAGIIMVIAAILLIGKSDAAEGEDMR